SEYHLEGDILTICGRVIEGVDISNAVTIRHAAAFYNELIPMFDKSSSCAVLMDKDKYNSYLTALLRLREGERERDVRVDFPQVNKWKKSYCLLDSPDGGHVLIHNHHDEEDESTNPKKASYLERVFADIRADHQTDHCRGRSLTARVNEKYKNISRAVCKLFSDTCPICIARAQRVKPAAGLNPLITRGFGSRGQVDLIDFQSMPDGEFKYLLNYIDHGCKFLFSVPIVRKRASCVAQALLQIFSIIGPPCILQSDNGTEFSGAALTKKQKKDMEKTHTEESEGGSEVGKEESLTDEELTKVIGEVNQLWPDCLMVRGSPRHSQSNGGVERVNRTVQTKLGAWMKENKSTNWSVGCRIIMFRYNTQYHHTVSNNPYRLVFGQNARVGISDLPFDRSLLEKLATEIELNSILPAQDHSGTEIETTQTPEEVLLLESVKELPTVEVPTVENQKEHSSEKLLPVEDLPIVEHSTEKIPVEEGPTEESPTEESHTEETLKNPTEETPKSLTPAKRKSSDEDDLTRWQVMVADLKKEVNPESIKKMKLRDSLPIIYCTDDSDITKDENFIPAYIVKVGGDKWEVVDEEEELLSQVEWGGDDGITNIFGMYMKGPDAKFYRKFHADSLRQVVEEIIVSPNRARLRSRAAKNLAKTAKTVVTNTKKKLGRDIEMFGEVGEVVHVPLADVDRAKADAANLTGVIVNRSSLGDKVRVAVKSGTLKGWYAYHRLGRIKGKGNNVTLNGLDEALKNWMAMPAITERAAAREESMVGGQGKGCMTCKCKGKCNTNSCSCKKAGRFCSSACHRNNFNCANHGKDA
ncbi:MAG: hypothetical protein ACO4AV_15605, partial [bacterium]